MKAYFQRFSVAIILLICFSLCISGCGGDTDESSSVEPSVEESSETPVSTETESSAGESINFGGETFTVIGNWYGYNANTAFGIGEVLWNADESAGSVNTAKKAAVEFVENKYGCKIEEKQIAIGNGTLSDYITVDELSGVSSVDILFESPYYCTDLMLSGRLTDIASLSAVKLESPWWDASNDELSLGGKLYFVNGSINLADDGNTMCILFNETLYGELNKSEPLYDSVRDGTWTFDKLIQLATDFTDEVVNDGVLNEFDKWGFGSEMNGLYCHVAASGEKSVTKSEDGTLTLTVDTEKTKTFLDKVAAAYKTNAVLVANDGSFSGRYENVFAETTQRAFTDHRELFLLGTVSELPVYNEKTKDKISVLPLPKETEAQERYYSLVSVFNSSALMLPKTSADRLEKTSLIVEALAESFYETVGEVYGKYLSEDAQTCEMLEKIAETRVYDLGAVFALDIGFPTNLYQLRADMTAQEYFQLKELALFNSGKAVNELNEKIKALE